MFANYCSLDNNSQRVGSSCEVFSDPANHCQEFLNRNTFQHFRSSWKRLIHFSFVVSLGFSLLMTAAKMYKWNGSAKRRIYLRFEKFLSLWQFFSHFYDWGGTGNIREGSRGSFSANTAEPPESSWFLRTTSLSCGLRPRNVYTVGKGIRPAEIECVCLEFLRTDHIWPP